MATQFASLPRIKPLRRPNRHGLPQNPQAAATVPATSATAALRTSGFNAPQTVGTTFTGATLADTANSFPPDPMGAVGPTQFIVACNGRIRSFNKTTGVADGALNLDMDVFFTSVMSTASGTFTADPRIRYDRLSGRWFVTIIDVPAGTGVTPNRVLIAVSSGSTITGGSSIPDGNYAITLSYQNQLGHPAATATHDNILIDTTAPIVTAPANVTVQPTDETGAVVFFPPATATDAERVVSISYSQDSGTIFPLGVTTVTVTAWDAANNSGTATFTVTVAPLAPLQSWRELHFGTTLNQGIAADTADPNNNGIVNLAEYALGGNPQDDSTGTAILPQAGRSPDNALQITFSRFTDRSDVTLTVQAADSPAGLWADLAQSTAGLPFEPLVWGTTATETGTGITRNVTVTDLYQTTDPAHRRRFMRLMIANPGTD
jgi:hypothetical protein